MNRILSSFINNVTSGLSIINKIDCSGVKKKVLFSEALRIGQLLERTFLSEYLLSFKKYIYF